MDLYKPEKYRVTVGRPDTSVALCTVWNDPVITLAAAPALYACFAIVGTLYGRAGIAALIRNLALNPHIRKVVIWNHGPLSQNEIGRSGTDVLAALWTNGIDDEGLVIGTSYRLEKEIDPKTVRRIVEDVDLVPAHHIKDPIRLSQYTEELPPADREARAYPDPAMPETVRWPSENVGWLVRAPRIIDAWLEAVMRIMHYGVTKETQDGIRQRELTGFGWVITDEDPDGFSPPADWPEALSSLIGCSPRHIADYLPTILTSEHGPSTYGARLRAYPSAGGAIDQVEKVLIAQLRDSPDSRRAAATTMVPPTDWNAKSPPCLTTVQCLQADGRLNMIAVFRSHDMFKAALPNAVALRHLQKTIAAELGFRLGELMIVSSSAHIYESDWAEAEKTIQCSFLGRRPSAAFTADPRGNFLIRLVGERINVTLLAPDGTELMEIAEEKTSAIEARIAQLGLIADPAHLLYMGRELEKARACRDAGTEYRQK